jgi:hypothetical protein
MFITLVLASPPQELPEEDSLVRPGNFLGSINPKKRRQVERSNLLQIVTERELSSGCAAVDKFRSFLWLRPKN